jgi:hypothetical protein
MSQNKIRDAALARQARTGESYNSARRAVIKEHQASQASQPSPAGLGQQVSVGKRFSVIDQALKDFSAARTAAMQVPSISQIVKDAAAGRQSVIDQALKDLGSRS